MTSWLLIATLLIGGARGTARFHSEAACEAMRSNLAPRIDFAWVCAPDYPNRR
jgi:hypothetical protein